MRNPHEDVSVTLVSGYVDELKVLNEGLLIDTNTKIRVVGNKGSQVMFVVYGDSAKVCDNAGSGKEVWYRSVNVCCDSFPSSGICLVPNGFDVFEKIQASEN